MISTPRTTPEPGDIGFSFSSGWVQRVIRAITVSRWSHCFVIGEAFGAAAVLEAGDWACQVVSFNLHYAQRPGTRYRVWRPILATPAERYAALGRVYEDLSGSRYGWLQLPWFIWNLFCRCVFRRPSPIKNPFPGGTICSELTWLYLHELGEPYRALVRAASPNEVSAQDLEDLILDNPKLFEIVVDAEVPA